MPTPSCVVPSTYYSYTDCNYNRNSLILGLS